MTDRVLIFDLTENSVVGWHRRLKKIGLAFRQDYSLGADYWNLKSNGVMQLEFSNDQALMQGKMLALTR